MKNLALVLSLFLLTSCDLISAVIREPDPPAPVTAEQPVPPQQPSINQIVEETLKKIPQNPPPGMDLIDVLGIGLAAAGFGWLARLLPLIRPLIWSIIRAFEKKQKDEQKPTS